MTWRVIDLNGCDIYTLHAAEDYFLDLVDKGNSPSVIMFSRLGKPAVSLGKMQHYTKDVDVAEAKRLDVDVARRETGGRSVYLDSDHYIMSVINRHRDTSRDVTGAYQKTCSSILDALREISGVTFYLKNMNDVMTDDDRKIGGAAQRNKGQAYLVHCYLRYAVDLDTMLRVIKIDDVKLESYKESFSRFASSLALETRLSEHEFYARFRKCSLGLFDGVEEQQLTRQEERDIETIVREKYRSAAYVKGTGEEYSRGNCDIIMGSGAGAVLRIPELIGKVQFR